MRSPAVCAISIIGMVMIIPIACDPFAAGSSPATNEDDGSTAEGVNDSGTPLVERDVRITVDWPTVAALDPRADQRFHEIRVNVGPSTSQTFMAGNSGPYELTRALVPATGMVDVTIEIKGGNPPERLIGFGARRKFQLLQGADGSIPVAVRKRVLYLTSRDRGAQNGELRALEGAPASAVEPTMTEPSAFPTLATLREPSALWITSDGTQLVQGGQNNTTSTGAIATFATGSHTRTAPDIELPYVPTAISPLGEDGYQAVVAYEEVGRTSFDVVDLKARTVTPLSSGIVGGEFSSSSAAPTSSDGRAAIVFMHRTGGGADKPYVATVAPANRQVTLVPLEAHMLSVRAVRFSPDGKRIVVAGYRNAATWSTAVLAILDAANPIGTAPKILTFAPMQSRPTALVLTADDGKHGFISNETSYTTPICCNEPRIIDLETGAETWVGTMTAGGPSHELLTAVRFPYAPFRVIGGQSDNGNNTNGAMVEINKAPNLAPTRLTIDTSRDFGSINGLASPFARQL